MEHLQAKKEAEERKNAAEEDDMFFTYAKDETYDQVPSPKSSSSNASMNKLKLRIGKAMRNGSDAHLAREVVVESDCSLVKKGEDFVDVIDDERSQDSPVDFRPSQRHSRKDSGVKDGMPVRNVVATSKQGRLSRQSSRSNSRSSSRSSSKSRLNPWSIDSPVHSPRHNIRPSKT